MRKILNILFGRRLANRESEGRKIGAFEGLAAMGLDGLGSSAYGPEAALTILAPLGAASLSYIGWVMAPIVALLAILFVSYWQTVRAYPNNGGAYIVSKENLGANASLLAAAALMIDYVLNVAVGISAGVGALVSAVPALHSYTLVLCLGILLIITIVNLRGTLDASWIVAPPTYAFIGSFAILLGLGLFQALAAGGHPQPVVAPSKLPDAVEGVGLWLLLRSFAAGCTAMTGVEAVSNGMSAFKEPAVRYGHRTLAAICAILGALLVGIAYLASAYSIGAMDQTKENYRSVLAQLAGAIAGEGILYYIAIGSLLLVLALSANTSFVGFPRLCRTIAEDGFLPKSFAIAGRRLVFSIGILYLAGTAGLLLFVFGGITDRLIPLFAIGAFLTFTMSQVGMVIHWRRRLAEAKTGGERRVHRTHLWINGLGAVTTGIALAVIVAAKFLEGAWITIFVIPAVILLLKGIRRYYDELAADLDNPEPLELEDITPPVVLVTAESWSRLTEKALRFALTISPDVIAVHLTQLAGPEGQEQDRVFQERWRKDVEEPVARAGHTPPVLRVLQSPYRAMHEPVLKLVEQLQTERPGRRFAVLVPQIVKQRWYQYILHAQRTRRFRSQLLRYGGPRLTVVSIPWYLHRVEKEPGEG